MAENVLVLKKKAVKAGMDKKAAMKASRAELESFLSGGGKKNSPAKKKAVAKKSKATTPAKKKTAKKNSKSKVTKNTKTPAKSKKSKKSDGGRNMIGSLDFTNTDGWNPRDGSPVAAIFKMLKKKKGNVDAATDALLPDAKEYVSLKKRTGEKRTKDEIRDLLRYRVNRTKWEFARRTGQHDPSENRIEYGTGDYAKASKKTKKPAKASKSKTTKAKKSTKKKTSKKK